MSPKMEQVNRMPPFRRNQREVSMLHRLLRRFNFTLRLAAALASTGLFCITPAVASKPSLADFDQVIAEADGVSQQTAAFTATRTVDPHNHAVVADKNVPKIISDATDTVVQVFRSENGDGYEYALVKDNTERDVTAMAIEAKKAVRQALVTEQKPPQIQPLVQMHLNGATYILFAVHTTTRSKMAPLLAAILASLNTKPDNASPPEPAAVPK